MKRRTGRPGTQAYYDALKHIFELESGVLTATLPHAGERGRNDEERFRAFLSKVLPRRFSIGTGFLVCSNPAVPPSRQVDTVIYDEIHNSPLHRELAAYVFPIEMIYGTVEVKGLLTPNDLVPALQSIAGIRHLATEKSYIVSFSPRPSVCATGHPSHSRTLGLAASDSFCRDRPRANRSDAQARA
ncbi:MAG: hypothetical protein USCGTAYLOR_01682 [Chromatiales bacterium USCg_Taylor]|nr:MAG: hypothetical protein USCGTAYLOR_01682 [Chromatiales bacterium USCg_Taylor]